jgi:hypothetical protein
MLPAFAQRQFAAVDAVSFLVCGALTGATLLLPVTLQVVSGYSPLGCGLALLPLTVIMLVLSVRSGQLAAPLRPLPDPGWSLRPHHHRGLRDLRG